jgi:DNA-binding MarR family transcriptional regulator
VQSEGQAATGTEATWTPAGGEGWSSQPLLRKGPEFVSMLTFGGPIPDAPRNEIPPAPAPHPGARVLLKPAPMNAIFFGLKRAFHGTLRVTRSPLRACGLTAARFDLLYALYERPLRAETQRKLARELGVTRSTVSRMLASLEALGLVVRTRPSTDRRQRWVALTDPGRSLIHCAVFRFCRTGAAQLAVDSALGGERWYDTEDHCFFAMATLDDTLTGIRRAFADSATLYYPWHPDD